jgi:uncharacterized protein YndB with AHSA1/START domain
MHDESRKVVWAQRLIPAPAERIFDLLADPAMHHVFDGSGTVRKPTASTPQRLTLGAKFGMNMRIVLPYKMTNTIVEFEENRRIGWRHVGGHVWRYILEPRDGSTLVTEEFDYSTNRARPLLAAMKAIERNEAAIVKTLENLERHFATAS